LIKKYVLFINIIFISFFCFGQSTVGKVDFITFSPLVKKTGNGATATIKDLKLEGYKDVNLMLQFVIYESERKLSCYTLEYIKPESNNYFLKEFIFEIPEKELIAVFGEGNFSVFMCFQVIVMGTGKRLDAPLVFKQMELKVNSHEVTTDINDLKKWHTEELLNLEKEYGLDILYGNYTDGLKVKETGSFVNINDEDKNLIITYSIPYIINIIKRYPSNFFVKAGFKRVVFVKSVVFMKQEVGGNYDYYDKAVFLTVGQTDPDIYSNIFAHEFFHYLETCIYRSTMADEWKLLNKAGIEYKDNSVENVVDSETFKLHPYLGFLNGYCRNDIYQDRAEIFSYLMTPGLYKRAKEWFKEDFYLKNKFQKIRQEVITFYPEFWNHYDPEKVQ